ncbi:2-dehydropantoate 2-reductase [Sediminibacillus dalangtanensis]|uniref:2-dehydropantoate 2-reductase n=1 Tax=Sediminibacillus dalangtanensis TaxID=2729421 RepID=A0ABX7VU51_9BACI|nr:2-dehydropantoate 2-reductase [Sediminibacillus dalangtanensis]QTM99325.1 2-dehydropantoate 2-reductase [Sediminibacillus dalangtanensis]
MKVGIIGGGAVGLLTAANLTKGNHQVTVYVRREEQKHEINKGGVSLIPEHRIFPVKALLLEELRQEDVIMIAVKQYQLSEILSSLQSYSNIPLIFLQNGMGHLELLRPLKNSHPVLLAVIEYGALKHDDHTVEQTGKGLCRIASLSEASATSRQIIQKLTASSYPINLEEDWYNMLAQKLVVNAVINPLTALFHVKNESLLKNEHLLWLAGKLCQEACEVLGLSTGESWEMVKRIAYQTKENYSSMCKDIEAGRRTEIDAISGYILEKAQCDLYYTSFAYRSIKALEMNAGGLKDD